MPKGIIYYIFFGYFIFCSANSWAQNYREADVGDVSGGYIEFIDQGTTNGASLEFVAVGVRNSVTHELVRFVSEDRICTLRDPLARINSIVTRFRWQRCASEAERFNFLQIGKWILIHQRRAGGPDWNIFGEHRLAIEILNYSSE